MGFFKSIGDKAVSIAKTTGFKVKVHKPEILLIGGITLMAVGAVYACKKTLNVDKILDEHKESINKINEAVKNDRKFESEDGKAKAYNKSEATKDKVSVYSKTVAKFAKNYFIPTVIFGIGAAAVSYAVITLKAENLELATVANATLASYNAYRDRVREKIGTEAEEDIYFDRKNVKVTKLNEDGTSENVTVKTNPIDPGHPFVFHFNERTSRKFETGPYGHRYNIAMLKSILSTYQDKKDCPWGTPIHLNDILIEAGLEPEGKYDNCGWLPSRLGGKPISFGLEKYTRTDEEGGIAYSEDGDIILEFNCEYISNRY